MAQSKVITGGRTFCYINGNLFGRIDSFSFGYGTPKKAIRGIDIPFPIELAPTYLEVTGTMTLYRLVGDGGTQGAGINVDPMLLSLQKYFTILITERSSDINLFKADYCSTDNESWTVAARGVMKGTVTFHGIVWSNEASPQ